MVQLTAVIPLILSTWTSWSHSNTTIAQLISRISLSPPLARAYPFIEGRRRRHHYRAGSSGGHWHFRNAQGSFPSTGPWAYLTDFGWCIEEQVARNGNGKRDCFHFSLADGRCDQLHRKFIEIDTFGTKPNVPKPVSQDEKWSCNIFKETTRHNGKRYESGLLWKTDNPKMPNNSFSSQRRLISLEVIFSKDANLAGT
jgi:hypothetical protein